MVVVYLRATSVLITQGAGPQLFELGLFISPDFLLWFLLAELIIQGFKSFPEVVGVILFS